MTELVPTIGNLISKLPRCVFHVCSSVEATMCINEFAINPFWTLPDVRTIYPFWKYSIGWPSPQNCDKTFSIYACCEYCSSKTLSVQYNEVDKFLSIKTHRIFKLLWSLVRHHVFFGNTSYRFVYYVAKVPQWKIPSLLLALAVLPVSNETRLSNSIPILWNGF